MYDEEVVVESLDGKTLGECRMLAWVVTKSARKPKWHGDLKALPGKSLDFVFNTLGKTVEVVCKDGASAQVNISQFGVGISPNQCTFDGVGPPPRSK